MDESTKLQAAMVKRENSLSRSSNLVRFFLPILRTSCSPETSDKEGEQIQYTGISQSAVREMALCSELSHMNVIRLIEIILEDKCIFMVFEYAEHDLLQIIHHHTQPTRHPIPPSTVKSIMFQLLNGCQYLHANWVL